MNSHRTEFILESREHLMHLESSLLSLEKSKTGEATRLLLEQALRAAHSLKGDAGFIGFTKIRDLTHAMESALEPYREGTTFPSSQLIENLLLARDRLATLIDDLDHSQEANIDDLLSRLQESMIPLRVVSVGLSLNEHPLGGESIVEFFKHLASWGRILKTELVVTPTIDLNRPMDREKMQIRLNADLSTELDENAIFQGLGIEVEHKNFAATERVHDLSELRAGASLVDYVRDNASPLGGRSYLRHEPLDWTVPLSVRSIHWVQESSEEIAKEANQPMVLPAEPLVAPKIESEPTIRIDAPILDPTVVETVIPSANPDRLRSLRINVELLDRLMNLVGELTLVRNQAQAFLRIEEGESQAILQRLNSVTTELQDTVLQTRMQPVGNLFGRFPRMVRDLARQLGKEVEVLTQGQEVELDKTVLERLSDPLTHLIRNSIDHGIETPEEREASNKPRLGKITLSATPADGQVFIEIKDNGRGIDPNAIKSKAKAMRLRSELELERMTPRELYSLILLPGFSTAKQVTEVSGRGVGMDVVKTNIEELEGTLVIDSVFGKGTTISLRVPLTLAIVPCLIATCNQERFAVPQRELEEIVCLHPGGKYELEQAYDTEVFRLRESLLPVVRLSEVLSRPRPFSAEDKVEILGLHAASITARNAIEYLLVLRCNGKRFGLMVDSVLGREEIVVKPMHSALKRIGIFSGATMMGDGRVALIVHAEGIIEHARCYASETEANSEQIERDPNEVHRVLLFEHGPSEQFALPLVQVKRVELIPTSKIEKMGKREYITIDGQSILILRLSDVMDVSRCDDSESMFLILPKFVSEPMGILANRIIDTESLAIQLQSLSDEPGILGTAIVYDKLSLFLDIQGLRELLFGQKEVVTSEVESHRNSDVSDHVRGKRVLLVDDTPFFREVVRRYLAGLELEITTAVDGVDGLKALATQTFDLVVSDIEMPNMNGWEFCKAAREKGVATPFVALTSLNKSDYLAHAKECGFDDFEEKLDHDRLKRKVLEWLQKEASRSASDER